MKLCAGLVCKLSVWSVVEPSCYVIIMSLVVGSVCVCVYVGDCIQMYVYVYVYV